MSLKKKVFIKEVIKVKDTHFLDIQNGLGSVGLAFPREKLSQELRSKIIETTMIYTHVVKELNKNDIKSLLDF